MLSNYFSGGRQATAEARCLLVCRSHCTRKDNSVIRVAASFLLAPFRGGTAAFLLRPSSSGTPCCRDRFQILACGVFHIFHGRRFCTCDIDGCCGRSGGTFVRGLFSVLEPEFLLHRRTHPNDSHHEGNNLARWMPMLTTRRKQV